MEMTGEYRIAAPRDRVWDGLNDPEVLKQCIPGCESMDRTEDGGFTAKVKAKVGPVSASFSGKVRLEDVTPPEGYRIVGEGSGGAAGFAKGGATVKLAEDGAETVLTYTTDAQVGGKLAQIGSRLIQGTAKKMADDFFAKFADLMSQSGAATGTAGTTDAGGAATAGVYEAPASSGPETTGAGAAGASPSGARPAAQTMGGGVPQVVWIGVAVVAVLTALFLLL